MTNSWGGQGGGTPPQGQPSQPQQQPGADWNEQGWQALYRLIELAQSLPLPLEAAGRFGSLAQKYLMNDPRRGQWQGGQSTPRPDINIRDTVQRPPGQQPQRPIPQRYMPPAQRQAGQWGNSLQDWQMFGGRQQISMSKKKRSK